MAKENKSCFRTSIGGQALIEGILMRGPERQAIVVRNQEGELVEKVDELKLIKDRYPILGWPLIRGVVNFLDSMVKGVQALMYSAEFYPDDEEDTSKEKAAKEKAAQKSGEAGQTEKTAAADAAVADADAAVADAAAQKAGTPAQAVSDEAADVEAVVGHEQTDGTSPASADDTKTEGQDATASQKQSVSSAADPASGESGAASPKQPEKKSGALEGAVVGFSVFVGIGLSIVLFLVLPTFLTGALLHFFPGFPLWGRNVMEGILKIVIFLVYLILCSKMKDIRRVFSYHGAEHKTIFCYEKGLELTVPNVRIQPRHHPRCGTSFLFVVIFVSILFSSVVFAFWQFTNVWLRTLVHLLLLPLVVAVTYEFNRWVGRHDTPLTHALTAPGMWMQNFTTNEPDDSMIECAIRSLELVIPEQKGKDAW